MKPRPSALAVRIRRLMLADDDVGKVAAATPGVIGECSVCVFVCVCVLSSSRVRQPPPPFNPSIPQAAPWNSSSTASSKPPPPS